MKKIVVCFLLFGALAQAALARVYRVHSEQEFKNILTRLSAGDEVIIANGNYSNWSLDISSKGTAAKPVLIRAESAGDVIFSGNVSQVLFRLTGSYTVLRGITFKGCELTAAAGKSGVLVELQDAVNCRLTNCLFTQNSVKTQYMPLVIVSGNGTSNKIDSCSFISNTDNQEVQVKITDDTCPLFTLIEHNLFKDKNKVSWKNSNGGECVQVGQDPVLLGTKEAKAIVRSNRFIHCNGESEIISNKSSGNSYTGNYFEANDGELVLRGGHDCIIADNVFEGGSGGIRVNGTGHTITNNKISGIKTAIRLMYGMAKGKKDIGFYVAASDCTIMHNQISAAETGILTGGNKNEDWTGKFDTVRYPSRVLQDIAPFNNKISDNTFSNTRVNMLTR